MTECLIYTLFISIPPENVRGYRNKTLAWNKLITFQQCPYDERCTKNGLHGHHPRDCLYYLRDYNIDHLKQLLDMHNVEYETEIPEYKQEGNIYYFQKFLQFHSFEQLFYTYFHVKRPLRDLRFDSPFSSFVLFTSIVK